MSAAIAVGLAGFTGAASAAPLGVPDVVAQTICQAQKSAELLRAIDRGVWLSKPAREAALKAIPAQAKAVCAPAAYPVRVDARQGRDPVSGTLRISCRSGYVLSPAEPAGKYWIRFGALSPESSTSVTRTARTVTSYEVDYTILPSTPPGGGLYLEGTCVPQTDG